MNDNNSEFHADRRHSAQLMAIKSLNIGANGRWFILALVAIAIATGDLKSAVLIAALLGVSVIAEQMTGRARDAFTFGIYACAVGHVIRLLVIV